MSSPNPSDILFSARYKYFLNYDNNTMTISINSASVAAGRTASYSLSIPIDSVQDFSQVQVNYSFDSSKWYIFPIIDLTLNTNFTVTTTGSFSGSNFVLTFYVVNQSGSTNTHPAFNVSASGYLFVEPS